MDLLQLRYFRTIAEQGSMSNAAKALYVSQPNLSVSMTRLEEELGVSLFDRRRGRIDLTESGKIFLKYVNRMFNDLDTGLSRIRAFSSDFGAQLSVATSFSRVVGNILINIGPQFSDPRIKQVTCRNDQICNLVLNEDADLGIFAGEKARIDLEYYALGEFERVAIVSEKHPLANRKVVTLEEMKDYYFILNRGRDDDSLFQYIGTRYGIYPLVNCDCDDDLMELAILQECNYISISTIPSFLRERDRTPGLKLKPLIISEMLPPAKIWLVRRIGHHLGRAVLQFETAVAEYYKLLNERSERFKREHMI